MKTRPFFRHIPHATGLVSRAPEPERYPYHDNDVCTLGEQVKRSGHWQYYRPAQPEEARTHCPVCSTLNQANS